MSHLDADAIINVLYVIKHYYDNYLPNAKSLQSTYSTNSVGLTV